MSDSGFSLVEKKGDLFGAGGKTALAHCISVDCRMGKGIAVEFKKRFGGLADLQQQTLRRAQRPLKVTDGAGVGDVLTLKCGQRYVFYLLTKLKATDKPTYGSMEEAVESLAEECEALGVRSLALPRIGCGLDGLKWPRVKDLLHDAFEDTDVDVTVYHQ